VGDMRKTLLVFFLLGLTLAFTVNAAYFAKFDGVDGES